MSIMPSRRIVAVGLLLCVAVGLIWWFSRSKPNTTETTEPNSAAFDSGLFENNAELQSFSVSPTTTAVITDTLLEKRELKSFDWKNGPKDYVASNLKIVSSDQVALKNYGLSIAQILKPLSEQRDNETEILIAAFDNNDYAGLSKIKSAEMMFETIRKNLLALQVPKIAAERHLVVLNGAQNNAWLLKNMGQLNLQPVLAMESGRVYLEESRNFFLAVGLLGKLFDEQGVTFSPEQKIKVYVNIE